MARRGRPSRRRKGAPLRSFTFGQVNQSVAGHHHRRIAVGLRTEARAVLSGPFGDRPQIILVNQLGQRLTPIVTDRESLFAYVAGEGGKSGSEIVAAALFELL